jgi:hypothetical protein
MKKLILAICGFFFLAQLSAQHESLFGSARVVGAFGAPIMEVGFNNELSTAVGGGAGIVINSIFIGAYGMGSLNFEQLLETGNVDQLDLGHGGLWVGFTISPHSLLHLYGSGRVGWGVVNVSLHDGTIRYDDLDKIFVATPEIGLEMNLARWFRVVGTIGYRYVDGVSENRGYTGDDFNGAVVGLSVRLGWFGNRRYW